MISLTIVERKETKTGVEIKRTLKVFNSKDKAEKVIKPIASEVQAAKREKRTPKIYIDAVSYDDNSEKALLLNLHAIESIDNEDK
ncbi:hypothetical protein J6W34_00285 [bacterium]|nr:hypothetical protein [bacterium]